VHKAAHSQARPAQLRNLQFSRSDLSQPHPYQWLALLATVVIGILLGCGAERPAAAQLPAPPTISLVPLLYGFDRPVLVTNAGDGSNRLFVVEKPGRSVIVRDG
jgi:hypothetical protein